MLVDNELIFSEAQSLSAAGAGENVIDLGQVSPTPGMSKLLSAVFTVDSAVTGTVQFKIQESDEANANFADIVASEVFTAPEAGVMTQIPVPYKTKRYLRAYFAGTVSAGKVSAFLTWGRQAWEAPEESPNIHNMNVQEVRDDESGSGS